MGQYDRKAQSQPKHGKPSSSGASKAPAVASRGRPGWKGPSYIKKKSSQQPSGPSQATAEPEPAVLERLLPAELQQLMLDVFRDAFPASNDLEALRPNLRKVKDALLQGNLGQVLSEDELLEAFAVRWSPSRALVFSNLLAGICEKNGDNMWTRQLIRENKEGVARAVCFGGGAAEIMAFAGLLRLLVPSASGRPTSSTLTLSTQLSEAPTHLSKDNALPPQTLLELHLVDTVEWSAVLSRLHSGLINPPALSKYASAAAHSANKSFLGASALHYQFSRTDMLEFSVQDLRAMIGPGPVLLTLLFTLNDLISASIPRTAAFLLKLTAAAPRGSLLLVVDNPSSTAEVAVGRGNDGEEKRKYPMQWLMDHVLLSGPNPKNEDEKHDPAWEKIMKEDNIWYRPEERLTYSLSLETNLKFEVHLFKRLGLL